MKITDVEAIYLSLPAIQQRTDSSQDALLVKVTTDAGIVGWGEVDGSPLVAKAVIDAPYSHTLASGLRAVLIGEAPTHRPRGCGTGCTRRRCITAAVARRSRR